MDQKYLPADVKTANLKKGETIGRYAEGVLAGKWKDKCIVTTFQRNTRMKLVEFVKSRRETHEKPLPTVKYKSFMKGVDRHTTQRRENCFTDIRNHLCTLYTCY